MRQADPFATWGDSGGEEDGCLYIIQNGHAEPCGKRCRAGSSYCTKHHELTHFAIGSKAEAARIREINAIAKAIGARWGRGGILGPSPREIEAIERRSIYMALRIRGRPKESRE